MLFLEIKAQLRPLPCWVQGLLSMHLRPVQKHSLFKQILLTAPPGAAFPRTKRVLWLSRQIAPFGREREGIHCVVPSRCYVAKDQHVLSHNTHQLQQVAPGFVCRVFHPKRVPPFTAHLATLPALSPFGSPPFLLSSPSLYVASDLRLLLYY